MLFFLGVFPAAHAQTNYQRIKSFGFPELSGGGTFAALIEGNDGKLYGTGGGGARSSGTVFQLSRDGSGYTVLYSFGTVTGDGRGANGLVEGRDGALYGMTTYGGSSDAGTVFKLNKDGSGYTVLRSFSKSGGRWPAASLVVGNDGTLYGTTSAGGANDLGTVFKINPDGSGYAVLYSFMGGQDAASPNGELVIGTNGTLYGTTDYGGMSNFGGGVFKLNPDGNGYAVLRRFSGTDGDGNLPTGLMEGSDGALYGTTYGGGTNDVGTVFKLNKDGTGYTLLRSFTGTGVDGSAPRGLVEGSDGALYGTTSSGGTGDVGTVFKLNKDGSGYMVLRSFNLFDGGNPFAGLVKGTDGALYGVTISNTILADGAVFKLNQDGSGYSVLYHFNGTGGDGKYPAAGLMEGSDGVLYGTTPDGGANAGTVFKLNRDGGSYAVVRRFTGTGGDGSGPRARLVEGSDGSLYGTTAGGGILAVIGTVFKLNKDGSAYRVLHSFSGFGGDGYEPQALVKGSDGALYGTTSGGGSDYGGTVFKLNQDGSGYRLLRSFTGTGGDGSGPEAGLMEGSDGALYGTTYSGGVINANNPGGLGTVFKLNRDGSGYTVLRRFSGTSGDGSHPQASLVEGSDGALYGTTYRGGVTNAIFNPDGFGTVFKMNRDGSGYAVMRRFSPTGGDGSGPQAGLVEGRDGALYGTTREGGSHSGGTLFKLNQDGSGYTVLRSFGGSVTDGSVPNGLLIGGDGALYGTTTLGGDMGLGTAFKLFSSPPQMVFANIQVGGPGVLLSLAGAPPGQLCQIQAATNLNSPLWQIIGTNTAGIDGKLQFLDTGALIYPVRFYRTAAQ